MVICPRGLAALIFAATLVGCGSSKNPSDDGGSQTQDSGDASVPTNAGGDPAPIGGDPGTSNDGDADQNGGDSAAGGDGQDNTAEGICTEVYAEIVSCCTVMPTKTQNAFMQDCQNDPFSAQQRNQFLAEDCDSLAGLCNIGNVCPASLTCFQVGVGTGVCASNGNYPANAKACSISTDCDFGLACYGDGTTNYCVQTCIPAGGGFTIGQCPATLTCTHLNVDLSVCGDNGNVPQGASICTDDEDCDSGWSCVGPANSGSGYCLEQCISS